MKSRKPEQPPEEEKYLASIDYRAILAALIFTGAVTTEQAKAIMDDRTYMSALPDVTPWGAAASIREVLDRINGEVGA